MRRVEMDWVDPLGVFRAASGVPGCVWLDSGGDDGGASRWSAILVRPVETIEARVGDGGGAMDRGRGADPFERLEQLHRSWAVRVREVADDGSPPSPGRPPLTGGVVALLGYDLGRCLERLPHMAADDPALPDLWAAVYDGAVVFDRQERRIVVTSWGLGDPRSLDELVGLVREAGRSPGRQVPDFVGTARTVRPWHGARSSTPLTEESIDRDPRAMEAGGRGTGDDGRAGFLAGVARIREEIARGEIYQANLTRRVARPVPGASARAIYEILRERSPTPFGAFVDAGRFQVLSASPERFVRIADGMVETRPIKGTRRRGRTESEDAALQTELLASGKDAAELLMIVDLERNDLGRVSRIGSVHVDPFPEIERYSTVSHLVATVRGSLRDGAGPVEVLRSVFPGGSITGAPKIRAMEVIEELEPRRRKFAMGSLVAWDFAGALDSSILIRTLVVRAGEAVFHVGAGIVADSVPEEEYLETVAKAAPLMAAVAEGAWEERA